MIITGSINFFKLRAVHPAPQFTPLSAARAARGAPLNLFYRCGGQQQDSKNPTFQHFHSSSPSEVDTIIPCESYLRVLQVLKQSQHGEEEKNVLFFLL